MEELNKKKLEVNATKLQLSTHMISLLELWLQKEGANINQPAEYFQRLLMSMPTEPEGALVRVRSKIRGRSDEELPPTFTLEVTRACKMGSGDR